MTRVLSLLLLLILCGCKPTNKSANSVVVYSSVDDVFARPICERFQKETGIAVKLVPDTEETKSTGLLNRLIAEKNRPQADVFWSGDPVRAAVLKARQISTPFKPTNPADATGRFSDSTGHWSALSARARVLIVNTNLVSADVMPRSINAFLDPRWRGKACLANPLFGTTSMHAAALFETMGEAKAKEFFDGMRGNGVKMLSSNGEVKRRVAAGKFAFGLTDTDDASVAIKEGKPVTMIYPDQDATGTLIVPNAAVLIANGPNAENGRKFIEYLLSPSVEQALAESEAAQMPLRPGVSVPPNVKRVEEIKAMTVNYEKLGNRLEELSGGFLRTWSASQ
ncbi:MAG: extracellular solute-binding protein [Verrucomicrobiales bacterium]|nr:extracellular solute-binding protein [Verrucomicrobiales bacterium]